jgi:AcrR family transcriptional regulator
MMARAQFDRDEVIKKSTLLFWQNGYSASSMQQVVKTTGLKPGSIYLAFGSKEALFRESLESYATNSIKRIREFIDNSESVGKGLCTFLNYIAEEALNENHCSCFLVKTQLELVNEGGELYQYASEKLGDIEGLFREYLSAEYGEEGGKRKAASIMLHIYGMRVYGCRDGSLELMRKGLMEGLPWLPWEEE